MDLFGGEFGQINEKMKMQERRQNIEKLDAQQLRMDYDLDQDQTKIKGNEKAFYDLNTVTEEQYQISDILANADKLKLSESKKEKFNLQYNRNENFRLINKKKFFGDSQYMTNVKEAIHEYESTLRAEVFGMIEMPQAASLSKDIIVKTSGVSQIKKAIKNCNKVIEECNHYLDRHRSIFFWRWSRRAAVEDAKARFEDELKKLESLQKDKDLSGFAEDLTRTDSVLTLMNKPALEEKRQKRLYKKNSPINLAIRNVAASGMENYEKETDEKRAVFAKTRTPRTCREAAVQLACLRGYDGAETLSCAEILNSSFTEDMPPEQKQKKIMYLESMFDEILKCDPADFAFKDLKDIFGPKFTKNYHILSLAHDADDLFTDYGKLLEGEDKGLLALNKEQFDEVVAKRDMLMVVYSYYDGIMKATQDDDFLHKDVLSELQRPISELYQLSQEGKFSDREREYYATLHAVKMMSVSSDGKKMLLGPGADLKELYDDARKIKNLPAKAETVNETRQALLSKLKEDTEKREEKKKNDPDTYGYIDFISEADEKYAGEYDSLTEKRKAKLKLDKENLEKDALEGYEKNKNRLQTLEKKQSDGKNLTSLEKKQLSDAKKKIKDYETAHDTSEEAKKAVKEHIDQLIRQNIEYDQAEKTKNEKIYQDSMNKCQKDLKDLLAKPKLSAIDKKKVHVLEQRITLMVHNRAADMAVYARNAAGMDYKKQLSFQSVMDISDFLPLMKQGTSFDELLRDFGNTQTVNGVYEKMAQCLMEYQLDEQELLSDTGLLQNMEKYNALAQGVSAFNRLLKSNPGFLSEKPELKAKLDLLTAASDHIRIKKQIFLSPANTVDPEVTLENYGAKKDIFRNSRHRRLLMVSDVMRRNLLLRLGKPVGDSVLSKKQANPFAEEDRQFALRLSREEGLKAQVDKKQGVRKKILEELTDVRLRVSNLQKEAEKATGEKRDNAILEIHGEIAHMKGLIKRYKAEDDADPTLRIRDALVALEEERLHVPFDFNMVDFDHIPKTRKGSFDDIMAIQESSVKSSFSDVTDQNYVAKKMGYEEFEKWIAKYKENEVIGTKLSQIQFKDAKTFINDGRFEDDFDRILCHFKGSYHFHFTDAQMREQIMMLSFSQTGRYRAGKTDEKLMAYQESAFKHMQLRLHSQLQGTILRNVYGGIHKMMYMTPLDKVMSINAMQKMELMASMTTSNINMFGNLGKYNTFMYEMSDEGRFMPQQDNIINIGFSYSPVVFGSSNYFSGHGLFHGDSLPPELKKVYDDFAADYKKKKPKAIDKEIGFHFLLAHPEAYNNKEVYKKKASTETGEKARLQKLEYHTTNSFHNTSLKDAYYNKFIQEDLTDEQIEKYLKEVKKDGYDEENFGKYIKEVRSGFEHIEKPDNLVEQMKKLEKKIETAEKTN